MSNRNFTLSPLAGALALALGLPAHAADDQASTPSSTTALAASRMPTKTFEQIEVTGQRVQQPQSPKFTQPLVDTPKTVTVVPAELMQDQGVTTLRDALRNVPGISMQAGEGGVPAGDNLTLRGFSARTDLFVDGVRDIGGYTRDPFNIEQVEVVKGPGSTHSGRGSTGGSINLASKTARLDAFDDVSLSVGDNALLRGTADLNHRIGDSSAFRINLMTHRSEVNGRDAVESERWGVAPTISFGLGGDTVTTFSLFHLEQDNVPDYGQPWVPDDHNVLVESRNGRSPVDRENWYGLLDRDYERTETDMATVIVNHAFNERLSLRNLTRWGEATRDSIITAPRFLSEDSTELRRGGKTRDARNGILTNVTDLVARFATGGVQHDLVAGLELTREESENLARDVADEPHTELFDPDPNDPYTGGIIRVPEDDAIGEADSVAVYLFDTLALGPAWELSGGLRWDRVEAEVSGWDRNLEARGTWSRTDTELSGRAAVVFKPRENGSVYLGYGTSFNPSTEELELNSNTATLDPEESRTVELGTKWTLFGDRLLLSTAIFRTEKTNARVRDPLEEARVYVLEGEQRVDGFEIGVAGDIGDRLSVFAGYTYLDSKVVESLDPGVIGNALGNTPRNSASLWTTYALSDTIEVGAGLQHVGSRYSNESNGRMAKSYTLYDMMVRWQVNDAFALRLNGYNLSDKDYVDQVGGGHYVPGATRTFMLSADIRF